MSNETGWEAKMYVKIHILDTFFFRYILGMDFTLREIRDERSKNDWNNKVLTDMN